MHGPTCTQSLRWILFGWLAILAGCGSGRGHDGPAQSAASRPCDIALTRLKGDTALDKSIAQFQEQAEASPSSIIELERVGWLLVAKARKSFDPGYYKLAQQCALCMETRQPHRAETMLLSGHVLDSLHHFKEAEAVARELVFLRGLSFDYGLLGDALMEQGKIGPAVQAYQKMIDQKPTPEAYSRAAHMRWLKGDLQGATQLMEMAAGANDPDDAESSAWARVRLASYRLQAGHLNRASALIQAALALDPGYPPALLAEGRLLLAEGDATGSIDPLRQAAQSIPLPEYEWALIEALRAADRIAEADAVEARLLERGAADDPRTFALYLATTERDVPTALRLASQELATRADIFTFDTLAWAQAAAGNLVEARREMQRALAEGTQDARLFFHAGVISARSGQVDAARTWLLKAAAVKTTLWPSERAQLLRQLAALGMHLETNSIRMSSRNEHNKEGRRERS
jgi:tetratricopeptide (TPR) repeat protein